MGSVTVGSLKSLGQGFLVAVGSVWLLNVVALIRGGDLWLAACYLLVLLIPIVSFAVLKFGSPHHYHHREGAEKWRSLLFAFQGVALAFWSFDLLTTFYAIDVTGLAVELNPLGWPLGILGAAAFYLPALAFSYVLLFHLKEKFTLIAAVPLTLVTLGMASMNLMAGAQNFQVFVDTAALAANVRFELLATIAVFDVAVPLMLKRIVAKPKLEQLKYGYNKNL